MTRNRSRFDIFLSYAYSDRQIAERLYSLLSKKASVFFDLHTLSIGDQWDYEIAQAQKSSLLSVFIISDTTPSVFYSREEVAAAISAVRQDRHVQRVVPMYVGHRADYASHIPYALRDIQAVHAQGERELEKASQELLDILRSIKSDRSLRESIDISQISNLPPRTTALYRRDKALAELSYAIRHRHDSRSVVLLGAGGIGKTQLALEYCYQHRNEFSVSWWVRANSADLLLRDLSALSIRLGIPVSEDLEDVYFSVASHLKRFRVPSLVVFDDVINYDLIQPWFGHRIEGKVIITSRLSPPQRLRQEIQVITLGGLALDEAVEVLLRETGREDRAGATAVASRLHGHPIALHLAAGQIKHNDLSFEEFDRMLGSFSSRESNLLPAAFTFPLVKLQKEHPNAHLLLEQLSLLADVGAPLWLFEGETTPAFTTGQLNEAAEVLKSRHLVTVEGQNFALAHVLVKEQLQSEMSKATRKIRIKQALELLLRGFPADPEDSDTWQRSSELTPHVRCVAELAEGDNYEQVLLLLDRAARFAMSRADAVEAGHFLEMAATIARRYLGEDALTTRSILGNLAVNLRGKGEVHEALRMQESLFHKALELDGRDSANTLSTMSNLADTFRSVGRLNEARRLEEEILSRYATSFGDEHPLTARAMNNLAGTLSLMGDLTGARLLQERLVRLLSSTLGSNDRSTVRAMGNLAMTQKSLGNVDEALRLQHDVCALLADSLGESHPDTLRNLSNLAGTILARGGTDEARLIYEKVLAGYVSLYGQAHPDTLNATSNLAYVLARSGHLEESLELNRRALTQYEELLGNEHPSTLNLMNNLADVLGRLGRFQEARELIQDVIARGQKILGNDHPFVLTSKNNLATILFRLGLLESAQVVCEDVLDSRTRVLGVDHPDTRLSAANLASIRGIFGGR